MKKTYDRISEIRDTAAGIHSGDVVWVGGTEGAASEFLSALSERRDELHDVTLLVVTGSEPNKDLEQLRHCGNVRVLSFYRDAITETYRTGDKRAFLTSPAAKAIDLICRGYGVNVMAVPVCQPKTDGRCAVDPKQVQTALAVSACPTVTKRIALVDYSLKPSADAFLLDDFDAIGLPGDLTTRGIFDNADAAVRAAEKAA